MKTLFVCAALAASGLVSTAASAQAVPAAVIAVVDLEKVQAQCTACKSAAATLQSQANGLRTREQALTTPLQAEQKAIQTAIDAAKGNPDAALQARIKAFETRREQGAQELQSRAQQIQRNQAYVAQQILAKLGPIYRQIMQRRGANLMLETGQTLATSTTVDVTNDVLAALNAALPSVATTAPAAPAKPQQPQGR